MWEKVKIKTVSTQIRGVSYKPKDVLEENNVEGIKLLRANNITANGLGVLTEIVNVHSKCVSNKQILKNGDILICASSGSKNLVGKAVGFFLNDRYTFGAFCKVIRPTVNILSKYLHYYFQSPGYRNMIAELSSGANINNIRNEHIDNLEIPLPPLPVQEKIAAILDKADELRRKDQELQDKYDKLAQAIFIDMFGDPVRNEKGWEVQRLEDLTSKIHSGNTPKGGSAVYTKTGIQFYRSQNVWKNRLDLDDIAFIDEATHLNMRNSSLMFRDILITKTGRINTENSSLGRAAMFLGADNTANINGHVYLIRINSSDINHSFVLYILTSIQYRDYIRKVCVGGIDKRQLNKEHIESFPIITPPLHLQEEFAKKIELINKLKAKANTERSEELFQSLLQGTFKGEIVSKTQLTE